MVTTSPRQRMIESAMILVAEQGVDSTSFSQVIEHSGAPRGSIYHHFPGGKAQLMEEATRHGGDLIANGLSAAREQEDPVAAVDSVVDFWRSAMRSSDYAVGCPVVAATVEGAPGISAAANEAFQRWQELHRETLQRAGVPEERARSVATLLVAAIEGAVVLARAQASSEPLERVVDELHALLHDALKQRD
jgi:AcrR family transcriptional regulator